MAPRLRITQQETPDGVVVITLDGRVMIGEESDKIEELVDEFLAAGKKNFVFDVSGVRHLDSTGIGRFISILNKVMKAGGKMSMAAASTVVREAFRVTRLDTVFEFFDTVEEACRNTKD